jgi:integrase
VRPPTPGQVAQLLEFVARDPALHLYLTLAATTGARRGKLLDLRWVDVDLVGGSLSIQRSLVEGPDGPLLVPTKTRRSYRVALDAASLELVRNQCQATSIGGGVIVSENRFVFGSDKADTRPWSPNLVTKRFIRVRRAAGLDHFRLHDLSHFTATQMLDAGVPVPIVAARLCHARASTTLNVYAHAVPGGDPLAAEALRRRVNEARGEGHCEGDKPHQTEEASIVESRWPAIPIDRGVQTARRAVGGVRQSPDWQRPPPMGSTSRETPTSCCGQ